MCDRLEQIHTCPSQRASPGRLLAVLCMLNVDINFLIVIEAI